VFGVDPTVATDTDTVVREIVRAAATLLPRLAAVVEQCRTEPDPGRELARACGSVSSSYHQLRERLLSLPDTAMTQRLDVLLRHELRILEEATKLAYRPRTSRWPALSKAFGDGLTGPADELLLLAARL
jgi:hypothetical protein